MAASDHGAPSPLSSFNALPGPVTHRFPIHIFFHDVVPLAPKSASLRFSTFVRFPSLFPRVNPLPMRPRVVGPPVKKNTHAFCPATGRADALWKKRIFLLFPCRLTRWKRNVCIIVYGEPPKNTVTVVRGLESISLLRSIPGGFVRYYRLNATRAPRETREIDLPFTRAGLWRVLPWTCPTSADACGKRRYAVRTRMDDLFLIVNTSKRQSNEIGVYRSFRPKTTGRLLYVPGTR